MVTDADYDQDKEGVDWDPNEGNRKCHDNKADGQGPENCQGEIQRHQFSWKLKFNLHLILMSFDFTPVSKKTVSKKGGKITGGY